MSCRRDQVPQDAGSTNAPDLVRSALDRAHQLAHPDHRQDTGTHWVATHVGDMSVAAVALTEHRTR
jgi:hypothetical protein